MNCPVTVAGVRPTVIDRRFRKDGAERRYRSLLLRRVGHNHPAPGDILDLGQSDALSMEFFY
jgi:hypothetical protein